MHTRPEILHALIVLGLFAFAPTFASAVPAFAGAQGGGAVSVGGRGGQVIEVTNLNDSGAGSLRACMLASGPRTCVFRVGGTIPLLSQIRVTTPFLTVAGQTAPGGGILLSGRNSSQHMLMFATHDVILRYIRVRKGFNSGCANECGTGNTMGANSYNLIFDHTSITWHQDEGIDGNSAGRNSTLSWNIVGEAVGSTAEPNPTSIRLGGTTSTLSAAMTDMDIHHNLVMNSNHRNPLIRTKSTRIVNNLFYNMRANANQVNGGGLFDIIANKYKRGPVNPNAAWHEIQAFAGNARSAPGKPSLFLSGNMGWHQANPAGDQYLMASTVSGENVSPETGPIAASWRRSTPMANPAHPISAAPVATIEGSILPIVGASRRLDCNGGWVGNRDSVDTRMVSQYNNNTGTSVLHRSEAPYGGYPSIAGGTPCTDTDDDGMPDVWETARGLNRNSAADRNAIAASGYTNLEVYLAGTGATTPPPPLTTTPPRLPLTTTPPRLPLATPPLGKRVS